MATSARKQVLLIETQPDLRGPAERILRKAGIEVVSVDSVQRAEGILGVSEFDLTLIGSEMRDANGGLYVDSWMRNPKRKQKPFLIICDDEQSAQALPDEAVIRAPFDTDDLLAKVNAFTGGKDTPRRTAKSSENPFGDDSVVEEALDNALGLDQIEVNESETLGGDTSKIRVPKRSESMVGYDADVTDVPSSQSSSKSLSDTGRIDVAFAQNKSGNKPPKKNDDADSDNLQLATHKISSGPSERKQPVNDHDYEWFVSEMQKETKGGAPNKLPNSSSELLQKAKSGSKSSGNDSDESLFNWDDSADANNISQVFTREMANAIAEKVAERLLSKLNSDQFLKLIHQEIENYLKSRR